MRIVLSTFAVALLVTAISSGESRSDTRPSKIEGWQPAAVGKVRIQGRSGSSHCTGTLIGPRLVLTAAHCLYDRGASRWVEPRSVEFLAGFDNGSYLGRGRVRSWVKGEGFSPAAGLTLANLSQDWAILELDRDLGIEPVRIRTSARPAEGAAIVRAGYPGGQATLRSRGGCDARAVADMPLLYHACGAAPGESGAPFLQFGSAGPEIVGILVTCTTPNVPLSLAVAPSSFAPTLASLQIKSRTAYKEAREQSGGPVSRRAGPAPT